MGEGKTGPTIAFLCLLVFIGLMIYNLAEIQAYNPFVVFGSLFLAVGLLFQRVWGDWFASLFPAKPEFVSLSGLGGRLLSGPTPIPGGRMKCVVSFNSSSLPNHLKENSKGGVFGFFGKLSGTIVREVIGRREQFKMVEKNDLENPNGCMFFRGRIDMAELRDSEVMSGLSELRRLSDLYRSTVTSMKLYGQQLTTLINQRHLDDDYTYNRAKMIAENMKNIKIITKGRGGEAEAIAGEM